MSPIRRRSPNRQLGAARPPGPAATASRLAAAAVVVALVAVGLVPPFSGPAEAQAEPSAWSRLLDLEASCGESDLAISGTLDLDVPLGATVAHRYEVRHDADPLPLGTDEVTATATTAQTMPFGDDIWFGPRWTSGLPFTYVMETVVRVDGVATYEQRIEARCTELWAPAELTITESVVPAPTSTTTSSTVPSTSSTTAGSGTGVVVPRYAG